MPHAQIISNASHPPRFDYLATKTHAIIVPCCGVDSVPSDAIVHLASRTLGHVPLGASTTSAGLHGGVPGGTIASIIAMLENVPRNLRALSSCDWALSPVLGARSPYPRLVYRLGRLRGGIFIMGAGNRAFVQRTAGLLALARLSGVDAGPVYGPAFTYTEFMQTQNAISALFLSLTLIATLAALTVIAPFRWFKSLVTQPGSGPADEYVILPPSLPHPIPL